MSFKYAALLAATVFAAPAFAEVDIEAGEKAFKKCKSCHMIKNGDDVIYKGGKTGPNLYGLPGRAAGAGEDFKYGQSIVEAGEKGLTWDAETFSAYIADPKGFLVEYLDDSKAKAKMAKQRVKNPEDIFAYLESVVAE